VEYAIRKGLENYMGLKLNWTCQVLVYADEVNLLADNGDHKETVIINMSNLIY
jgi:hypothetical protein